MKKGLKVFVLSLLVWLASLRVADAFGLAFADMAKSFPTATTTTTTLPPEQLGFVGAFKRGLAKCPQ